MYDPHTFYFPWYVSRLTSNDREFRNYEALSGFRFFVFFYQKHQTQKEADHVLNLYQYLINDKPFFLQHDKLSK